MKLSQKAFFEKTLGVPLRNHQWSWGAFDPAANRVFLRIWKTQIEKTKDSERVIVLGHDWNREARGYPERLRHIENIESGAEGIGILCEPRIAPDESWHIKDYEDKIVVRLGAIEKRGETIYARIFGSLPIEEIQIASIIRYEADLSHKVTRICFNTNDWQRPSGDAIGSETGTYNTTNGFGHEEWLFRSDWLIDGWRYTFLQGVNKSREKLVVEKKPFNVELFTILPDGRRQYIAFIKEAECLNDRQAEAALEMFKARGWFKQMKEEIKVVNGKSSALGNSVEAEYIVNIRFRLENLIKYEEGHFAEPDDPIMQFNRYQLYDSDGNKRETISRALRQRRGSELPHAGKKVFRQGTAATEYTPEHALMQRQLVGELKKEFPTAEIMAEKDFIDVSVRTETEILLFEIKSDLEPRVVIRLSLGQILEYAFHPQRKHLLNLRLFIVGRRALSTDEAAYLDLLRRKFLLPLEYRVVEI